jgi:hypothetical protein
MNTASCTAILIDTVSIQQYIFNSNKLKENLGASYIIEELIYSYILKKVIDSVSGKNIDLNYWKPQNENDVPPLFTSNSNIGIGYIGGGNALLLLRDNKLAHDFKEKYTLMMLEYFPGIKVAFGEIENFDPNSGYKTSMQNLIDNLILNKSLCHRNTAIFKPGIVKDCAYSNEADNIEFEMSAVTEAKMKAADLRNKEERIKYPDYSLTDNHEMLGQPSDKGYLAVVHIDGNGIGQKFRECNSLLETRQLSCAIKNISDSLKSFIYELASGLTKQLGNEDGFDFKSNLPIRIIISGGDDVTFVSEGKLGCYLAEKFIEEFRKQNVTFKNEKIPLEACAGIAIVKTNYPFFRAYKLSEGLIKKAKEKSKENGGKSYLHYMIAGSGYVSDNMDALIKQQFSSKNGILINGPYCLENNRSDSFENLKQAIRDFTIDSSKKWPRNKLKELREVLHQEKPHQDYFLQEIDARQHRLTLHAVGNHPQNELWASNCRGNHTPYYDVIELAEFYPSKLL